MLVVRSNSSMMMSNYHLQYKRHELGKARSLIVSALLVSAQTKTEKLPRHTDVLNVKNYHTHTHTYNEMKIFDILSSTCTISLF